MSVGTRYYQHGLRRLTGRDVHEKGRVANTLELFYDLTFVSALGVAGSEFSHALEIGSYGPGLAAFLFALIAVIWAWTGYTWFSSAYDNDDWLFRVLTLGQMIGVIVIAIGIPEVFRVMEAGEPITGGLMVFGYVIIRVCLVALWVRVLRGDPDRRFQAVTNIWSITFAQTGWVIWALTPLSWEWSVALMVIIWVVDLAGPIWAQLRQRRRGAKTMPWHPHHTAERYGLFAILSIGETVLGTLASAQAITDTVGWSLDAWVVIGAGLALSFGFWWAYFLMPSAPILEADRGKFFGWAIGHIPLYASIAATGAGLHVLGYVFNPEHPMSVYVAVTAVALPVLVFLVLLQFMYSRMVGSPIWSPTYIAAFVAPPLAMLLAWYNSPLWLCLLVVLSAPVSLVVAYETTGWKALQKNLDNAVERANAAQAAEADAAGAGTASA